MSKIITRFTLCIVLLGLLGTASALPCPDLSSSLWNDTSIEVSNINLFYEAIGADEVRIYAQGTDANPTTGAGFREICVYVPDSGIETVTAIWNISGEYWDGKEKDGYAQFSGKGKSSGNQYNIPFDGNSHAVGDIVYSSMPDMGTAITLVHINDPDVCAELGFGGETCYVKPESQLPPIPEMSPLILTTVGIIGLILVSRKYILKS